MSETIPPSSPSPTHHDVLAAIRARITALRSHVNAEYEAILADLDSVPERVQADAQRLWGELKSKL